MKNLFNEFKKFITRGNVVDMAVGVIVGGAFTGIVNALSNNILKPIINWVLALILGKDALSEVFTFLKKVYTLDAAGNVMLNEMGNPIMDLTQSIYIDWGAFINAVINFFLIALVLFAIVKIINTVRDRQANLVGALTKGKPTAEEKKEMRARGVKLSDKEAVAAYYAEKARIAAEEKAAAEEAARLEKEANPSTEELLKQIRDLLANK